MAALGDLEDMLRGRSAVRAISGDPSSEQMRRTMALLGIPVPPGPAEGWLDPASLLVEQASGGHSMGMSLLGVDFPVTSSGLYVPRLPEERRPTELINVFITLRDYMDIPAQDVIDMAATSQAPSDLLRELANLSHIERNEDLTAEFTADLLRCMNVESKRKLEAVLADGRHRLLARQPIVLGMMFILRTYAKRGNAQRIQGRAPTRMVALLLTHAIAEHLGGAVRGRELDEAPDAWMLEFAQNMQFNQRDDPLSLLVRHHDLWSIYLPQARSEEQPEADGLLAEATGLGYRQHLAYAFAMYAFASSRKPNDPFYLDRSALPSESGSFASFVSCVAATLDVLSASASKTDGEWNCLPILAHPILAEKQGLLVLDEDFILQRATSGLRHYVDNHVGTATTPQRTLWDQHYGSAVESMAEDGIRALAPKSLMDEKRAIVFDEEDMRSISTGKRADIAVCYGADWCVFEVVAKRLTARAMHSSDIEVFKSDIDHLVIHKAAQLAEIADALLSGGAERLAGIEVPATRVCPVVVCPEGVPASPLLGDYIRAELASRGLMSDSRVVRLAVLDLGDLELLESLLEHGHLPNRVLHAWGTSRLAHFPLSAYAWHAYPGLRPLGRPSRIQLRADRLFDELLETIGYGEDVEPQRQSHAG